MRIEKQMQKAIDDYKRRIEELEIELSKRPKSISIEPRPNGRYMVEVVNCRGVKYTFTQPFIIESATKIIEDCSKAKNEY